MGTSHMIYAKVGILLGEVSRKRCGGSSRKRRKDEELSSAAFARIVLRPCVKLGGSTVPPKPLRTLLLLRFSRETFTTKKYPGFAARVPWLV